MEPSHNALARAVPLIFAIACGSQNRAENWHSWYDAGTDLEVVEPLEFTDQPYDFPSDPTEGIQAARQAVLTSPRDNDGPLFAPDSFHDDNVGCDFWGVSGSLPRTIEGVVTSHPRVYRKIEGCNGDERYYGSYWLQDATGGVFVLADTKVAHFDMGDRVRLEVRSMRRRYGIDMVYTHNVLYASTDPEPISYRDITGPLGPQDQSEVVRAEGWVVTEPSTFGEILVAFDPDSRCGPEDQFTRASCLPVTLDVELSRRGIEFHPGEHIRVTGPVHQNAWFGPSEVFNFYGVHLSRLGQIERL